MNSADNQNESIEATLSAAEKKVLKAFEGREEEGCKNPAALRG